MSNIKQCFKSRFGDAGYIMEVDYCLDPSTRVLTEDFDYKQIHRIEVGDVLIGFEEELRKYNQTQFKSSVVTHKKTLYKQKLRITFDDGTSIMCSEDHNWVARTKTDSSGLKWVSASNLGVGDYIPQVLEVWEDKSQTPDGAWMGGFLDGEGWISHASTVGVGQNLDEAHQPIWDKMIPILERDFGDLSYSPNKRSKVVRVTPNGLRTAWKAVGMYKPTRLMQTLKRTYEGTILRSKRNRKKTIVSIESVGVGEVIAIQTATKTFIAEGMPSHNCQLETYGLAVVSGDKQLKEDLLSGVDMHCVSAEWVTGTPYEEILAAYKAGDKYWTNVRKKAKTPRFAMAYGAMANSLAQYFSHDKKAAQNFIDRYYERYPQVKLWQEETAEEVKRNARNTGVNTEAGWPKKASVITANTGRRYHFETYDNPWYDPSKKWSRAEPCNFSPTQMKNFPVQGFATGDIVPMILGALYFELRQYSATAKLINTVHDSVLLDVHEDAVYNIAKVVKDVMESAPALLKEILDVEFDLPLPVEVEIGRDWYSKEVLNV